MKSHVRTLPPALIIFFAVAAALTLNAQITNAIQADVDHSFVVGDKTLPPGEYTFRMTDSDESLMIATSHDGTNFAQFLVRQSIDGHRASHSELVFHKYGDTEFLNKVFQAGSRNGLAVTEPSKREAQLINEGQQALEHSEVQK